MRRRRSWRSNAFRPAYTLYIGGCRVGFHRLAVILWPWYLAVLIHEVGHALAAVCAGGRVRSIMIGPARAPKRGVQGWVRVAGYPYGLRFAWFCLGGPLASILTGVLLLVTVDLRIGLGPGALNLSMGLVNLWPRAGSDGMGIWQGLCEWRRR